MQKTKKKKKRKKKEKEKEKKGSELLNITQYEERTTERKLGSRVNTGS